MERKQSNTTPFLTRLRLAARILFDATFAQHVATAWTEPARPAPPLSPGASPAPAVAPERAQASGLLLLAALQREGRLIDFLQQEVAGFADAEVGAAARVVHAGCRQVLAQYLELEPALGEAEGAPVTVPKGFDAQRIRLTGNVAGQPPFRGEVKHHGWVAKEIRMPAVPASIDPRILAPAEVELA